MAEERLVGHTYTERLTMPAAQTRVRYTKEVHLKNLYIMLHEVFVEEGWAPRKADEWPEHYYLLRETNKGDETWIWWRFKKVPGDGENKYYRYILDLFWHIIGVEDIEVMHQGKKFKTNKANLEINITSKLEMDYMHEVGKGWRDNSLLKSFNDIFHKRIFKADLEKHKHDLYRETYKIQETIKTFLGLRTYMPEPEGQEFWPTRGIGDREGMEGTP